MNYLQTLWQPEYSLLDYRKHNLKLYFRTGRHVYLLMWRLFEGFQQFQPLYHLVNYQKFVNANLHLYELLVLLHHLNCLEVQIYCCLLYLLVSENKCFYNQTLTCTVRFGLMPRSIHLQALVDLNFGGVCGRSKTLIFNS